MNVYTKGAIMVAFFFSSWLLLSKINWVDVFEVEQKTNSTEEKIGDLYWEVYKNDVEEVLDIKITSVIDSLVNVICEANYIDASTIKVHVMEDSEINAFALPNRHLVLNSGLISDSEKESELAGVICHELAHIELDHVMDKLIQEIGLSVVIGMVTGTSGGEIIGETARIFTSSAFDRAKEKEADLTAVTYLENANIDPEGFANFLYKLSRGDRFTPDFMTWMSTHPASEERATYVIEQISDPEATYETVLPDTTWNSLKTNLMDAELF